MLLFARCGLYFSGLVSVCICYCLVLYGRKFESDPTLQGVNLVTVEWYYPHRERENAYKMPYSSETYCKHSNTDIENLAAHEIGLTQTRRRLCNAVSAISSSNRHNCGKSMLEAQNIEQFTRRWCSSLTSSSYQMNQIVICPLNVRRIQSDKTLYQPGRV